MIQVKMTVLWRCPYCMLSQFMFVLKLLPIFRHCINPFPCRTFPPEWAQATSLTITRIQPNIPTKHFRLQTQAEEKSCLCQKTAKLSHTSIKLMLQYIIYKINNSFCNKNSNYQDKLMSWHLQETLKLKINIRFIETSNYSIFK